MKKNKKNLLIVIFAIILFVLVALIGYFFITNRNENKLSLEENKWIDTNKYNMIDVALMNDVPVISYDGEGVIYEYLDYVTNVISLKFNVIPFKLDNTLEYQYKMDLVDKPEEKDIVILKDNMVLLTNKNIQINNLDELNNIKIGVLSSDKENINKYLNGKTIEFIECENYSKLKEYLIQTKQSETLEGIIISKTLITKEIIENDYNISYQFNDLNKYFVLKTEGNSTLNSILKKNYNVWYEDNFKEEYNDSLLNTYFKFKNISDANQKRLNSKSYVFGFIDYGIYNYLEGNKISGLSGLVLKDFNAFSNLSITYTQYNSLSKLLKDFNSNKVDFMMDISTDENYKLDINNTVGVFDNKLAIISDKNNKYIIDGIKSLEGKKVLTIKDSSMEKYLTDNNINVKSYNNMKDLTKDFSNNDIVLIDIENYNYYKSSAFKDCKINYILNSNNKYNFVINNKEDNKEFNNLFNFYSSYISINELISVNYNSIAYDNSNYTYLLVLIVIILAIYVILDFYSHIKVMFKAIKKSKKVHLSKEDKIKYIDQLTSLKNRAYLNSRIESWDESEIYPQAIIIIDLNNIAYINDNYGREEGDKVITEAANILIQHQLQNSEIIRTDGNEFLIYLVGYNEKQIISYLRKLNKEFKSLSHGFGVASGYSIITDAIKTVDDAVNEATIDMKNNKEDIDY